MIKSYSRAATAARAELLPAGVAWQLAWRCNARTPLYGPDDFHPSPTGTYAAARLLQAAAARALGRKLPAGQRCG